MIRIVLSALAVIGGLIILPIGTDAALADRRVALVVGNSQYKNPSNVLLNPQNDAKDVAESLRALGFEVIQTIDADKREFDRSLQQFARLATDADAALFFYAGHAMQHQGHNYLMPIDAELEDEISLSYQMVAFDSVRFAIDRAKGVKIMILDACRNNPVADRFVRAVVGPTRDFGNVRGLARIGKTQGMVVSYATSADDVAEDGKTRNSPYTSALLKRMQEAGLEIEMMFRRVAQDVTLRTNGRQRPETVISLLSEFYLNRLDAVAWEKIKDTNDSAAFRAFMTRFPSSVLAIDAKYRLDAIERAGQGASRPTESNPDEVAWSFLKDSNDVAALKRFVEQFPNSSIRSQAETRIAALAAELPQASKPVPAPRPDSREIARLLQLELKRVGCFNGAIDGEFSSATRAALRSFVKLAAVSVPADELTPDALKAVRDFSKRVCPLVCPSGERAEDDRCVRISCPDGQMLKNGTCIAQPSAGPKRRTAGAPMPKAHPSRARAGNGRCFAFGEQRFCQ